MSEAELKELIRRSESKKELNKAIRRAKCNLPEAYFALTWTQLKDWATTILTYSEYKYLATFNSIKGMKNN